MQSQTRYLWNGELSDQSLEYEYSSGVRKTDFKTIRIACLLTATAYLGGALANYLTFGVDLPLIIISAIRIAAFMAALGCFVSTYRTSSRLVVDRLILFYFLILVLGDSVELLFTPSGALPELPGLIVVLLVYYMFYPTRLHLQLTGGVIAGVTYCTVAGLVHGFGVPLFANAILAFLLVNLFGIYHVRTMNRARRMMFVALMRERKTNIRLQGEIDERRKIQQKLFEQATTDELTKVYNRRFFMELAQKELSRSKRHRYELALIMVDLDHFKDVNDNYGHDMGDMVLRTTIDCIRDNLREEDLIGRLGGEEFAVILPETDLAGAVKTSERIRSAIEALTIMHQGVEMRVTASLGVTCGLPDLKSDLDQWLKSADNALYSAKGNGRNQVVAAPPPLSKIVITEYD
jgi:diguanylate cyclase